MRSDERQLRNGFHIYGRNNQMWQRLHLIILALATSILTSLMVSTALAAYPEKHLRVVVPYSPGGSVDTLARVVFKAMTKSLGQPVIIDNRAGGNTAIGTDIVAKAPADGYTVLAMSTTHATNAALRGNRLPYDSVKDFSPVTLIASTSFMLGVHPTVPAKSVKELIALAKARPGELNFAIGGAGTAGHLTAALFTGMTGTKVLYIPYKGAGPAFIDLVAGHVDLLFSSTVAFLPYVRNGRVRALAVTGLKRTLDAPDVPTIAESGLPGFESSLWFGILAPTGTPKTAISRLQQEIAALLRTPEVNDWLKSNAAEPGGMPPDEFGAYLKSEFSKWGKVVREAGIKAD